MEPVWNVWTGTTELLDGEVNYMPYIFILYGTCLESASEIDSSMFEEKVKTETGADTQSDKQERLGK